MLQKDDISYADNFKVQPDTNVKLKHIDPSFKDRHQGHKEAAKEIVRYQKKIRALQKSVQADRRHSLRLSPSS